MRRVWLALVVIVLALAALVAEMAFSEPAYTSSAYGSTQHSASSEMHTSRLVTANIGRKNSRENRARAIRRVPLGITGWQEISPAERRAIRQARPRHGWACPRTRVPITAPPRRITHSRVTRLHPGIARVTKPRIICEATLRGGHTVVLNTHLIQGAWTRPGQRLEGRRTTLWHDSWRILRQRVRHHLALGREVWVTGDLNRSKAPRLLAGERRLIGWHNDYVLAYGVRGRPVDKRHVRLRIDGHQAHRVVLNR